MLLAVDVGNSNTVIGVFEGRELVEHWRIATDAQRTADEFALLFQGFMAFQNLSFSRNVHGVVLSSVVPLMTERLVEMTRKYFHFAPVVVRPGTKTGFAINMDNPREVGADRLVNAVATHDRFGGPGVVVDFGTSTNFDVYTADATFIGGVIAPGVMLSMEALSSRGAQLPKFELRRPRSAIGRNTVEAMQSGAVFGFAGQVDRIVEEILEVLGGDAVVVATGGLASAIVEECSTIDEHDPWLTLSGLRLIWERNTT